MDKILDPNWLQLISLLIQGGLLVALIKALYVIGKIALGLQGRITAVETDLVWIKNIVGQRRQDRS